MVDNGSNNNSVEKIEEYLREYEIDNYRSFCEDEFANGQVNLDKISNKEILFYRLNENYGFAKGNNKGLEVAKKVAADYYLLLNNDTEVMPDFLNRLNDFITSNPAYSVLTPKINLYFQQERIWNCGGSLNWGFRKYYYGGQLEKSIKEKEYIDITFVTGCALFFKSELLTGNLFTERFFHGEEDFDFSYRMKEMNVKMACVLNSKIFHKVGVATKDMQAIGKTYCYYLLRFIDVRQHMSSFNYQLWRTVYTPFIIRMLFKRGYTIALIRRFIRKLYKESEDFEGVDRQMFLSLLTNGI